MFGDNKTIKILFFGDLVGRPGRFALRDYLSKNVTNDKQFIIANVENASHGFGLTEKNYNEISEYGIDCMTSGNHIWDKKRFLTTSIGQTNLFARSIILMEQPVAEAGFLNFRMILK